MNFSKLFKSSNAYSGLVVGLFAIIAIIGLFTLMGNSNSNRSSNYLSISKTPQSSIISNELQMPSVSLPLEKNNISFLDDHYSRTLEEEVISTMAPTISNENLGNPSYLPVIDSNLDSTDINELN